MPFLSSLRRSLACLALVCSSSLAQAADPSLQLETLVPHSLGGGLQLAGVRKWCDNCPPSRTVQFYSNDSPLPVRTEKVSVQAGVTAMYAYPGTDYFANVKVEQSAPGRYAQDKAIVIDAIDHEFRRKQARVATHLAANPEIRAKLDRLVPAARQYLEFERRTVDGIEYVSYTENVIGLTSGTVSQIHLFLPGRDVIVSAYLLKQKNAKFRNIDEFLSLRADFIRSWIDHLGRLPAPVGQGAADHAGDQQARRGGFEGVREAALPQKAVERGEDRLEDDHLAHQRQLQRAAGDVKQRVAQHRAEHRHCRHHPGKLQPLD